jgi:LysM repeat protein
MSEQAPERRGREGGNVFTHKIGPLPMLVWVVVIGGVIVAWSLYKSRTSKQQPQDTGTPASDVPQFVNQTYTTVSPPSVSVTEPPEPPETAPGFKPPVRVTPGSPKPVVPRPGGPAVQPPIFNATYVVRAGDTLNSVAKRFGITRVELAHANGLGTGAGLRTGERIKVPEPPPKGVPNKAA